MELEEHSMTKNRAPKGLGPAGRAVWRSIADRFDLEDHEAQVLGLAARAADRAEALRAVVDDLGLMTTTADGTPKLNPAVAELRQVELEVARHIASLRVPDSETGARPIRRSFRGTYAAASPLRSVGSA
jgi:hypothetical protein